MAAQIILQKQVSTPPACLIAFLMRSINSIIHSINFIKETLTKSEDQLLKSNAK